MHTKERLIKKALLSSPLIALYGISPIVLFGLSDFSHSVVGFVGLAVGVFLFWGVNLYLIKKITNPTKRYVWSFVIVLCLHLVSTVLTLGLIDNSSVYSRLVYSIIATLAVNSIILIIIDSELNKERQELAEAENNVLKISNLEAQKKILIQQLQPHFLFNTLSTLKSLIRENPTDAEEYTLKLSEFWRYAVQSTNKEMVELRDELNFTMDYIALQQKRFGEALHCVVDVPKHLLDAKLPIFAVQTLVENAVKHNKVSEKKPLELLIAAEQDRRLKITNKKLPKAIQAPSGTGLANLNERYLLMLGTPLEIRASDDEFTVVLRLAET